MRHDPVQGWASKAGLLSLPPRQAVSAETLGARIAVAELFARYGIAHDEVDRDAMLDLFTDDAELIVSLAGPPFERHTGRAAIADDFVRVAGTQTDQRRHAITNIETEFTGPARAASRAYGIVTAADAAGLRVTAACVYASEARLGPGRLWRFSRLWIGMDMYLGHAPGTE